MAHWNFMPKYMESQFRLSASKSNLLTGKAIIWTNFPSSLHIIFWFSPPNYAGTIGIICNAVGILVAGLVISKFKPSPRHLAAWNVMVEFLQVIGYASYTFMSCPEQQYYGPWGTDNKYVSYEEKFVKLLEIRKRDWIPTIYPLLVIHRWNLTETCNAQFKCGNDIQFAPVCDTLTGKAFYSPCHAGCNSTGFVNGTLVSNEHT